MTATTVPDWTQSTDSWGDHYGCGYTFAVAAADQTGALLVTLDDPSREGPLEDTELSRDQWEGEVRLGESLFANWCTDVRGSDGPEVESRWPITSGSVTVLSVPDEQCDGGTATIAVRDLVANTPEGDVHLPDSVISSDRWGCFPG
ncbi:MAG: hypothetical protein ACLFWM_02800 [Actinomycetota bacterium]